MRVDLLLEFDVRIAHIQSVLAGGRLLGRAVARYGIVVLVAYNA